MTKADIIEAVHGGVSGLTRREATEVVEVVFETIKEILVDAETVKLPGFGTFVGRDKKARNGRNPRTRQPMMLAPRRVVTYKVSKTLNERLN